MSLGRAANSIAGKCPPTRDQEVAQVVLLSNSRSERINRHIRIEVMLVIGQGMRQGLEMECAEDSRVVERRDEEAVHVQDFGRNLKQK